MSRVDPRTPGVGAPSRGSHRSPPLPRVVLALLAACTPVTTRPDFRPDPRALVVILDARPERVTTELATLVAAESLVVERVNVRDGYLETRWYDPPSHRSYRRDRDIGDLGAAVKVRCWADPYVPGQTRLTIEAVYRPRYDPSRAERDLEVAVPKEHQGYGIAEHLFAKIKEKIGVPKTGS